MNVFAHPDRFATPQSLAAARWYALRYAISGGIIGAVALPAEDAVLVLVVLPTGGPKATAARESFAPLVRWVRVPGPEWEAPSSELYGRVMLAACEGTPAPLSWWWSPEGRP